MRLDRALISDLRIALHSRAILAFLALESVAGAVFVLRRGEFHVRTVAVVWAGMLVVAFFAWWAGRDRRAHATPDPLPGAPGRSFFALLGSLGMALVGWRIQATLGAALLVGGIAGWIYVAGRSGGFRGLRDRLARDPRPFIPLLLIMAVPRLLAQGPSYLLGAAVSLPSGIGQQLLYLLGLFAPLEALRNRTAAAAVIAALIFATIHVPFNLPANEGDWLAAAANAVVFQASAGLIACLAFVRHRAAVPIGVAHALAIG